MELENKPLPLIYDLSQDDLKAYLTKIGQPGFRSKQLWQGIYHNLWSQPTSFPNLPIDFRNTLGQTLSFSHLRSMKEKVSSDGETRKILFQLPDDNYLETVLMKYHDRNTLCISTQSGCAMGCTFCATGQMGFFRSLTSGEIVEQVLYFARHLQTVDAQVTNIVFMGMGEPFHNYENTLAAIDRLNDPDGFNLGARRMTISTVGVVPKIRQFADERRQVNLAVSLHSTDNDQRSEMMPINKKYPVEELLEACRYYVSLTHRRITFEWALIAGVNDSVETAQTLARKLKGLLSHINVIPLNPTRKYNGSATTASQAIVFKDVLEEHGIACTVRLRRGMDIQAGCGQLASDN